MLVVQNDWIEYEEAARSATPRLAGDRGGAVHTSRGPVSRPVHGRSIAGTGRPIGGTGRSIGVPASPGRPIGSSAGGGAGPRPGRLRLTRRGRIVLVVFPALLALSGAMLAAAPGAAEAAPRPAPPRTVVVGTGDSLWTIAARIAPHTDPRTTVAAIQRANGLADARVDAGVTLVVPAR